MRNHVSEFLKVRNQNWAKNKNKGTKITHFIKQGDQLSSGES
jgi:hypothetical protein